MKKRLFDLMNQRRAQVTAMENAIGSNDTAAFDAAQTALSDLNGQIERVQAAITEAERFGGAGVPASGAPENSGGSLGALAAPAASQEEPRASREYARAFCSAIRAQAQGNTQAFSSALEVITNAMTESGGAPVGSDGGFLVPEDVDTQIRELRRALNPLSALFTVEPVTAPKGYRVLDEHPTAGFTKIAEMEDIPADDQPKFTRISYAVEDYGLYVPVSNDLLNDNDAGLMAYLSRWFAKKGVLTENNLLKGLLSTLVAADLAAGKEIGGIKQVLNVGLDPDISVSASIITNQDAFNVLDQLTDDKQRPLLQPDPVSVTQMRLFGRPVKVVSNAVLPTAEGKAPIYIGDFKQFGVLFTRQPLEVDSTSVGGNAWRSNSTEVRGIMRLDAKEYDKNAAKAVTVAVTV